MNISNPIMKIGSFLFLLLCAISVQAQLSVKADRPDATYRAGEQMSFVFSGAGGGTATYRIQYDRGHAPEITSGTVEAFGGQGTIPFTLNEPGFVFCYVTINGQTNLAGAAFSPFEIDEYESDPDDYDEFWDGWKAQLAAVPMNPSVTPLFPDPNAQTTDFRISLGHIDGRRVYGYVSIPPGEGPFPAIITHASFGGFANTCIPRPEIALEVGAISVSIWMHNIQPDQQANDAYLPEVWSERNTIYHRYGILGLVRTMDYIETMPEFNGEDIGLFGVSEGGGLSMLAAAIDDRATMVGSSIFAMSEHTGFKHDRASGFPFFLLRGSTGWPPLINPQGVEDTKYYDALRAAKRIKVPFYGSTSYQDETVMPGTNFGAFNQLKGSSVLIHKIDGVHLNPDEFFFGKFNFMRKHFGQGGETGYFADAGTDIFNAEGTVSLSGKIEFNGVESNSIPVEWELVDGPGQIQFSNKTSRTTQVNFTEPGEYLIRFRATDQSMLAATNAYFTITDHVIVSTDSIGGGNICVDVDGDGFCLEEDCDDNNADVSQIGDSCDDGNADTIDDVIQADCSCSGTVIVNCDDLDNDGICADLDCDDTNPDIASVGDACDDGDSDTENDVIQADCSCAGTVVVIPPPPSNGCDAVYTIDGLEVTISGLNYPVVAVKIFDHAFSELFVCNPWTTECGTEIIYNVPLAGTYFLHIQTFPNFNDPSICNIFQEVNIDEDGDDDDDDDEVIVVDVCEEAGGDEDGDGICFDLDCDDNDASISLEGDACDDGDANTVNDVIQADCSCAGTEIPQSGCPVVWNLNGNTIEFSNIIGDPHDIKVLDANLVEIFGCSTLDNGPICTESETFQLPGTGTFYVQIQLWNGWENKLCEVFEKIVVSASKSIFAFNADKHSNKIFLTWAADFNPEFSHFEVQRSLNGLNFHALNLVANHEVLGKSSVYHEIDAHPFEGKNFYRIKFNRKDGTSEYSDTKIVQFDQEASFELFPNPATETVNVSLRGYYGKNIQLNLVDQFGKRIKHVQLDQVAESFHSINLSDLRNGVYVIWVFTEGQKPVGKKLIVNRGY